MRTESKRWSLSIKRSSTNGRRSLELRKLQFRMATTQDKLQATQRLAREQPRNKLVIQVCGWLEEALSKTGKNPLTRAQIQKRYRERKKKAERNG